MKLMNEILKTVKYKLTLSWYNNTRLIDGILCNFTLLAIMFILIVRNSTPNDIRIYTMICLVSSIYQIMIMLTLYYGNRRI